MNNENKEQFTPGYWVLNNMRDDDNKIVIKKNDEYGDQKYFAIEGKSSFDIVGFYYPHSAQSDEQMIANAALIAASKDMYYALREVEERLSQESEEVWEMELSIIRAALQKANP